MAIAPANLPSLTSVQAPLSAPQRAGPNWSEFARPLHLQLWITSPRLATARFTDLPALRRPLCVVGLAPFIGAFFSRFPQEHNKVLQFRRHFLRRLKALPKLMPNDGLQGVI